MAARGEAHPWDKSPVPAEYQIRGLGPITLSVPDLQPTDAMLTTLMDMREVRAYPHPGEREAHGACLRDGRGRRAAPSCTSRCSPICRRRSRARAGCITSRSARRTPNTTPGPSGSQAARAEQRQGRSLLVPQPVFPRAERHPVRDRHGRPGLRRRRTDGQARRELVLPPFLEGRRTEIEAGLKPL